MNFARALLALSLISAVGCDDTDFNTGETVKVSGEGIEAVKQVMEGNCVGCHGASNPSAGLDLTSDAFCDSVLDDRLVVAGNSGASVLQQRIDGDPSPMPPTGVMDGESQDIVRDWIDAGADCDAASGGGDDGGDDSSGGDDSGGDDTGDTAPDGETVFASSCASCHGASGEGGFGPAMSTAAYGLDAADVADIALNGSDSGGMAGQLTDTDEADAVGAYVVTTWGG